MNYQNQSEIPLKDSGQSGFKKTNYDTKYQEKTCKKGKKIDQKTERS